MRRTDPRSAQIGGPEGIAQVFQVKAYNREPVKPGAARNLFPKDDCRAALLDKSAHFGPEVALVGGAPAFACFAEGLAGTGSGPDGGIIGDAGESEGKGPASDAREEVNLGVPHKVIWTDIYDAPLVHVAGRKVAGGDQVPQPTGGERVDLVVVGAGHGAPSPSRPRAGAAPSRPRADSTDHNAETRSAAVR
jgi:hypothetical protein